MHLDNNVKAITEKDTNIYVKYDKRRARTCKELAMTLEMSAQRRLHRVCVKKQKREGTYLDQLIGTLETSAQRTLHRVCVKIQERGYVP